MSSVSDFANSETWLVLTNETEPTLYKAARCEFEAILGGGDVRADDIREIREHGVLLKKFLCSYVDGLVELFCVYGAEFYGDGSADEELHAECGRSGYDFRDGSFKNTAKAFT